MMELKVTLVQTDLAWEDKKANLLKISEIFGKMEKSDLVLLPEMFSTGFSMNTQKLGEEMNGQTVSWMLKEALRLQAAVAGSLIIREGNDFYNRLVWAGPDGKIQWYDKKHLFSIGEEHLHFTPGHQRVTVGYKGWKIRLQICYDLRFPVWSRNQDDYDLLIYTANWPSARHHVWKNLLVSRALENQCYCAGINRLGKDGMGLEYSGDSVMVTPRGEASWMGNREAVQTFALSLDELNAFREKFPVLNDRDGFIIE